MSWDALAARARGRFGHLVPVDALSALERSERREEAFALLAQQGLPRVSSARDMEKALRRRAADDLQVLGRWAKIGRGTPLAPLFADEDRRSLRALVRGAIAHLPPALRIAAALPTPTLDEGALTELARQASVVDMATVLRLWGHPFAGALASATRESAEPWPIELALDRAFAAQALESVRRGPLRDYLRLVLDVENAISALVLSSSDRDTDPDACFLEGGARLDRATHAAAAGAQRSSAVALLLPLFPDPHAQEALRAERPAAFEYAMLTATLRDQRRRMRIEPVGPSPVLVLWLSRRWEARRIRRVLWQLEMRGDGGREAA